MVKADSPQENTEVITLTESTEAELIAEYERRGWSVTITKVAVGCCGVGKKLIMTWMT
ncbi:hypothetical protein [Sporosarcina sp. E16_8]|uniref:hypothetical protein n=1 Tax=Sporosarcina sp. E16_8 TaxID=2789295 RepID=UPI001A91DB55|nr:hypothetical protein [Sporosarcina sp. E16_8]MBO0586469.1 hypothetical protein [Sporosarcina sp. E16_8]